MAQPLDPNSQSPEPTQPSNPNRQAGQSVEAHYHQAVAAFKAQRYDQALAIFQRLGQLSGSPYSLKATMGQVRVYQRLGQVERAKQLCQQLSKSSSSQVKDWADQVLGQLPDHPKPNRAEPSPQASTPADLSGFMPLETPSSLPQQPPVPRSPSDASRVMAETPAQPPPDVRTAAATVTNGTEDKGAGEQSEKSAVPGERSLFHFQQLNQQPGGDHPDDALSATKPVEQAGDTQRPLPGANSASAPRPTQNSGARFQQPLPKRLPGLWVAQGATAIALLWGLNWAISWAINWVPRTVNGLLRWVRLPVRLSLSGANQPYTLWIIAGLVVLAVASPWIMDQVLAVWYRQRPFSTRQLQARSPDTLRLLRQVCRQQGWQLPELRLIPDDAPLCFSYGWWPSNTRIVISQGILDHCSDTALTALYGYELACMVNGSLPVISVVGLPLLLLHSGYRWLAQAGDGLTQSLPRHLLGLLANGCYGLFWLLRQPVLWLSRLCCTWDDRRAVALTQHPDHLVEGLVELTQAIATHLQQRGSLHPLHTSLEVLMPVSSRQAITSGSLLAASAAASAAALGGDRAIVSADLIAMEGLNPYRQWLRVNASHIPLGERLLWLNQQALGRGQPGVTLDHQLAVSTTGVSLPLLLLQKGPLVGLMLGGGLAMGLWFLGGIVNRLGWQRLSWLYLDPSILWGGLWLGLGLGLLLRINALFADKSASPPGGRNPANAEPKTVGALLQTISPLPVQGQPVVLQGKLIGASGMGNWGCQDLYLDDSSRLVRLVNPAPLGFLQGLQTHNHPLRWIGRRVMVTGWGRYGGGMLWVDIDQIRLDPRHRFQVYGPAWATLISLTISLIGIVIIVRGA